MLQKQKDFWKKQAETEYILALNEKEKVKALEETQKGWTQRVNESAWLLQGVEKDTTKLLHKTEEQKAAEEIEAQLKAQAKQVKKEKKSSIFTKVVRILTSERKKREAPKRVRYADLERQEELAKELIEQDERKNRLEFLIESNARLRVLYRVRNWLHVPRMPVHHKPLQQYSDYTPECTNIEYDRTKNLKNYESEEFKRIEEDLKSWEEIIKDENEAMKFRVAGRHHQYLGAERLFPLKIYPTTIQALLPVGAPDRMIPENQMLPDEKEKERLRKLEEEKRRELNRKVTRIRKGHMDMSRAQVRLPPNVQDDASSAGDVMIGHKQAKSKPQFEWKKRDFVDQNSVYDGPHPPVAFKSTTPQKKVVPVMLEDDISCITSNAGSQVHYNIIEEKSIGSKTKAKGVEEIVAEDESAMQMEIDDYYSDLALRSNYHSMNSTKGEVIPIKMKRHRGVQQLDRFKVKHNMKVMSLNTKKNIIHDRNIHTAPA